MKFIYVSNSSQRYKFWSRLHILTIFSSLVSGESSVFHDKITTIPSKGMNEVKRLVIRNANDCPMEK